MRDVAQIPGVYDEDEEEGAAWGAEEDEDPAWICREVEEDLAVEDSDGAGRLRAAVRKVAPMALRFPTSSWRSPPPR